MMWSGASTGMIKFPLKIVCDSGPIIHLDELNCLHLLADFQEILVSHNVHKEIKRHRRIDFKKFDLPFILVPEKIPNTEFLLTLCRIYSLDTGEIEALAYMEENPQAIFLTDDASARMVAEQMGLKVHGTIGILVRSIRRGQMGVEEVLCILKDVPSQTSLYIKPSLLDEVILRIKKEYNL
jgi:predicted nucleic acid-binding protein